MKKQLLTALVALISTTNMLGYNFYVANLGSLPIKVQLFVKGVAWNWDKVFTLNTNEYCQFETLAYCGNYVVVNDGRGEVTLAQRQLNPRLPAQTFNIPWQTACHMHQLITVNTQIENNGLLGALAAQSNIVQYTGWSFNYKASLTAGDIVGQLSGMSKIS